jgi:hypothetical protein
VLTSDVRFEGWTTEEWIRFVRLWQTYPTSEPEPSQPRGGLIAIHEDGEILKLLHTRRGRLDPSSSVPVEGMQSRPLALRGINDATLEQLARKHGARWALAMQLGALDEVMERFGARARREDDLTAQSLMFVGILQELIADGAIATWPQRLRGIPLPNANVVRRALDALCSDGQSIALGLFDAGGLWTALVARRRGAAFDLVAGPDELRPALGLLSGDWRRDYRHFARAVEDRYAPLGFGCFSELSTFRALQTDGRPGAWSRAVAVRDVVLARMPVAVGLALGLDGARYVLQSLRAVTEHIPYIGVLTPALGSLRERVAKVTGKDISALLGFDPLEVLRALLNL